MPTAKERTYAIRFTERGSREIEKSSKRIDDAFGKLKTTIGAIFTAYTVQRIASFAFESSKLAGTYDDLRRSLSNLTNREGIDLNALMKRLEESTAGTISQIELMKNATQAKFLGIDLKNLPVLFEFARQRAKDTGQEIDYLVQSIVTGIGRRSALILDNLGIQIRDLNEEMERIAKQTGTWTGKIDENIQKLHFQQAAVNIAKKGIAESGETIESNVDKVARMTAQWENFQVLMGKVVSGPIGEGLSFVNKILSEINETISAGGRLEKATQQLGVINAEIGKLNQSQAVATKGGILTKLFGLDNEHQLRSLEKQRLVLEKYIDDLNKITEGSDKVSGATKKATESIVQIHQSFKLGSAGLLELRESMSMLESELQELDFVFPAPSQETINAWDIYRAKVSETSSILADSFFMQWQEGISVIKSFERAFIQMLERLAAEILSRMAIFGLLSFLGLGGPLGGFTSFVFGGIRDSGGPVRRGESYIVGGSGPEMFTPTQSGHITPISGQNIYVTINTIDSVSWETYLRHRGGAKTIQKVLPELL